MSHGRHVRRMAWYRNHGEAVDDWLRYAWAHGYGLPSVDRGGYTEYRVMHGDECVALLQAFDDETFAFVFQPEYGASRWSELRWRLTHPFARRKPLPWPRRQSVTSTVERRP